MSDSMFDELPLVEKFFGIIPVRSGSLLISVYGLASGGLGLAIIILYALGAFNFITFLLGEPNEVMKRVIISVLGILALVSTIKNIMLMLGAMMNSKLLVTGFVWITFITNFAIIILVTSIPLLCFFDKKYCILNSFPWAVTMCAVGIFFLFLCVWTYFLIVANSFRMRI